LTHWIRGIAPQFYHTQAHPASCKYANQPWQESSTVGYRRRSIFRFTDWGSVRTINSLHGEVSCGCGL